jgi:prolyl-tRNA synthetase
MKLSQLVGRTTREAPRDSELPSHKFLVRAGYVRQYSSGIWGFLPLAWRSLRKIEEICRQEMNAISGQEIRMPTLATRELWEEAGRYQSIGKEMFRLKDRHEKDHVLCMTHEEPVVFLARTELTSYKQLPAMLYQFQTKFRDEPRPRGGLVRTREFIMKDAYSFHTNEDDLLRYYERAHTAYDRFFRRIGFRNHMSVRSDNGIFGGKFSHEFMALTPFGEDTLITCDSCTYRANVEVATTRYKPQTGSLVVALQTIATPGKKTIAELVAFLQSNGHPSLTASQTCKAVLFQRDAPPQGKVTGSTQPSDTHTNHTKELIAVFVRGDLEIVSQKVITLLGSEVSQAEPHIIKSAGACAGSTGPLGLDLTQCRIIIDPSVADESTLVVGANAEDQHLSGFNFSRDFLSGLTEDQKARVQIADTAQAVAGDPCPECGGKLTETRGIEIGNIFHLGTKYTAAMDAMFLDQKGKRDPMVMGCYGIGISRCLAALIEEHHDEHGMKLPIPIAPFEVHLNALNLSDPAVAETAQNLYAQLSAAGIEVLFDDRDEKPGSQFADADLIGIPIRVVVAPRSIKAGTIEIKYRDKERLGLDVPVAEVVERIKQIVSEEYALYKADAE